METIPCTPPDIQAEETEKAKIRADTEERLEAKAVHNRLGDQSLQWSLLGSETRAHWATSSTSADGASSTGTSALTSASATPVLRGGPYIL